MQILVQHNGSYAGTIVLPDVRAAAATLMGVEACDPAYRAVYVPGRTERRVAL